MNIKLLITFIFFCYSLSTFAQVNSFISVNPIPTHKSLNCISDYGNTIYICGDEGSIFKSTNYGVNWINISIPYQVNLLKIKFFNKDTGFITGINPNFSGYTTNGGTNWIKSEIQSFSDLEFVKSNVGYGIINNVAPRKTTNGGINWQIDSNIMYQGSSSSYFTSIKFVNELTGYISEVSNTTNTTKIRKTTNGGLNWNLNTTINSRIYNISVLNKDSIIVFGKIGSEKQVAYTSNQGLDWITHTLLGITADPIVCWDGEVGVLASAGDGKVYISYNLGQFWSQLSNEYITDVIKVEQDFYSVGVFGRMYKSNNGNNWTNIQYSASIGVPFFDKYNLYNVYYRKNDGIYKFDTISNTFIYDNRTINTSIYYQYSPTKMIRIVGSAKSVSTNNGQTWSSGVNQNINPEIIGLYYYNENNGIAVSRWGTIWKDFSGGYGTFTLQYTPADTLIAFCPIPEKNKLLVFSTNGKKIFYSDTTGENWQTQNNIINTTLKIVQFIDTTLVVVDVQNRIHYSSNLGQSWSQIYSSASNESIIDVRLKNNNTFYILKRIQDVFNNSTSKFATTTNRGQNWTDNFTTNYNYSSIDLFKNGYIFLYGGNSWLSLFKNGGYFEPILNSLFIFPELFIGNYKISNLSELNSVDIKTAQISSDRNFNNILLDTSFIGTGLNFYNSCVLDYNSKRYSRVKIKRGVIETGWKVDSTQIPGKLNFGIWLFVITDEVAKQNNNKIYFLDSTKGFIVSDSGRIFKTNKSGICWEKIQLNTFTRLNDFLNYNESNLFICGDSGKILNSTNEGSTWQINSFPESINLISFTKFGQNIFVISQNGKIYKSTDVGTSWNLTFSDSNYTFSSITSGANDIYISGKSGLILKSNNNGLNWQNISFSNNINLNEIQIFNEKIFIPADSGKIFTSVNGGMNFNLIQTPIFHSINSIYSFENSIYATCNNSTILKSTNSGLNWAVSTRLFNNEYNHLNSITILNNRELWVAGNRNTVVYIPNISNLTNLETFHEILVNEFKLYQNFPNPFNPETTISFDIPEKLNVRLKIINLLGQEIAVLVQNEIKNPGKYNYKFNGKNFPSGIYFYILETDKFKEVKKMVLIK